MNVERLADGLLWYVVFLFSTTLHEAAHAFTAMKLGDYTAYHGGQVTLHPAPHIRREPFGTVIVPILTFLLSGWMMGWASAPYDPQWALRHPRRAALMSLAGPLSNLLLVICAAACIRMGVAAGIFAPPESITFMHLTDAVAGGFWTHVATMVSVFFSLNLLLFAFNLLPVPPLDGSGALPLFMSERMGQRYMLVMHRSGVALLGLLLAWQVFGYAYAPLHRAAMSMLYPGLSYR
ncbi:MAG TPA: site-2 protease family protein [Bacteroidota bacterium]|nr:site-2 protease family protein [Bacteroidota bacterium]